MDDAIRVKLDSIEARLRAVEIVLLSHVTAVDLDLPAISEATFNIAEAGLGNTTDMPSAIGLLIKDMRAQVRAVQGSDPL